MQANLNANTDHTEIFGCRGAAGTGGRERSCSVALDGEKTFKRPPGLLKICVMMERTVRTRDVTVHALVPLEMGGSVTLSVAEVLQN